MSATPPNTGHMRDLLRFLNSMPWTDEERGTACATLVAAYVLHDEGRGTVKTWLVDVTVKGVRAKVRVVATCNPELEEIAKS